MPTLSFSVIAILAMLISGLLPAAPCMAQEQPLRHELIRVAISRTADTVTLDGDGLLGLSESGTAVVLQTPVVVRSGYGQISAGGVSYHKLRVSAAGPLKLNNKSFRGVLELSAANDGLLVVNELPLEQYLVGVINSEISSTWPMESVKAQAVIARTYAVAKRNERRTAPYHLEATVMDQVYDGSDQEDSRAARGSRRPRGRC